MEEEMKPLEDLSQTDDKPKIKPAGIVAIALGVLLVIGGIIYFTWPGGEAGEDIPPALEVREDGKFQGLIKYQGQALDAEDDLDFFEFKQAHVEAWTQDKIDSLQAYWGDPSDLPVSIHYYYVEEDVSVRDLLGQHITNATEANFAGDNTVAGLVQPQLAEDVASEYDEGIIFAVWSPGEDDYQKGWHVFPEGPFDPEISSEINYIDDPDDFIIPKYRGFLMWPTKATISYGVKDESTFATSFPKPLENTESGWVMVVVTDDPENVLGTYADRIDKIFELTGDNTFEEVDEIDQVTGPYSVLWLKLTEKTSVS